jgi:transcriptional regulator with XRE-family HTH domain
MRSKSEFKATRERVGITQAALASIMGVSQRSVRYWEHPISQRQPPEEAWRILDDALDRQRQVVSFALQKVDEAEETAGTKPNAVRLPYWLTEGDYVQWSTDSELGIIGDWRMANANNQVLAIILEERGVNVEWVDGNPARPTE